MELSCNKKKRRRKETTAQGKAATQISEKHQTLLTVDHSMNAPHTAVKCGSDIELAAGDFGKFISSPGCRRGKTVGYAVARFCSEIITCFRAQTKSYWPISQLTAMVKKALQATFAPIAETPVSSISKNEIQKESLVEDETHNGGNNVHEDADGTVKNENPGGDVTNINTDSAVPKVTVMPTPFEEFYRLVYSFKDTELNAIMAPFQLTANVVNHFARRFGKREAIFSIMETGTGVICLLVHEILKLLPLLEEDVLKERLTDAGQNGLHELLRLQERIHGHINEFNKHLHEDAQTIKTIEPMLKPRNFDDEIERLSSLFFPGSREWLFDEVHQWRVNLSGNSENQMFWLQAGAGMGKSVFAACLSKRLAKDNKLLGSVLFKFSDKQASNPVVVLKSLVYQIAVRFPAAQGWLKAELDRQAARLDTLSVQEMFRIFLVGILGHLERNMLINRRYPMVIIFDALDESGPENSSIRRELLTLFGCEKLPSCVKWFVTGRPELDIRKALADYAPRCIYESDDRHQRDLELFLRSLLYEILLGKPKELTVSQWQEEHSLSKEASDTIESYVQRLLTMSEGKFVYVGMVKAQLMGNDTDSKSLTLKNFKDVLQGLPVGLDDCYQKTFQKLRQTMSETLLKSFLYCMVASSEPMSETVVKFLVGLDGQYEEANWKILVNSMATMFPLRHFTIDSSNSPIAVDGIDMGTSMRFYPYHKSIVDWLIDPYRNKEMCIDSSEANIAIAVKLMCPRGLNLRYGGKEILLTDAITDITKLRCEWVYGAMNAYRGLKTKGNAISSIGVDEIKSYALYYLPHHLVHADFNVTQAAIYEGKAVYITGVHVLLHHILTSLSWMHFSLAVFGPTVMAKTFERVISSLNAIAPTFPPVRIVLFDLNMIYWIVNCISSSAHYSINGPVLKFSIFVSTWLKGYEAERFLGSRLFLLHREVAETGSQYHLDEEDMEALDEVSGQ